MNHAERVEAENMSAAIAQTHTGRGPGPIDTDSGTGGPGRGMAKRKHQISTLYGAAKQREYELLRSRGGVAYNSAKTKRETQGKYGW